MRVCSSFLQLEAEMWATNLDTDPSTGKSQHSVWEEIREDVSVCLYMDRHSYFL